MTIINELVNGNSEIFETNDYVICPIKDFHPLILKIKVFSDGKKIKSVSRPFKFFYKHFTFKSEKVQKVVKELNERNNAVEQTGGQ